MLARWRGSHVKWVMRVLLVYNPVAGQQRSREDLVRAVAELEGGGWSVDVVATAGPGDTARQAYQGATTEHDAIVVVGGDGTVQQAVNGLLLAKEEGYAPPALGILPAGTANVLAHDLGLPAPPFDRGRTLPAAARLLVRSSPVWVDVGRATIEQETRSFMCWAGIGLDAAITAEVMAYPKLKQRLGPPFFLLTAALHIAQTHQEPMFKVQADGETWEERGALLAVSNIPSYALVLKMAPSARIDDGWLDVTLFRYRNWLDGARKLVAASSGRHIEASDILYTQARHLVIEGDPPQYVHLDAEPFGRTPVTIEVMPRALPLLVPPTPAAERVLSA